MPPPSMVLWFPSRGVVPHCCPLPCSCAEALTVTSSPGGLGGGLCSVQTVSHNPTPASTTTKHPNRDFVPATAAVSENKRCRARRKLGEFNRNATGPIPAPVCIVKLNCHEDSTRNTLSFHVTNFEHENELSLLQLTINCFR